jgi:hypothetical protein
MTWEEALDLCDETIELLEDLPEAADEYAMSCLEKVQGIRGTIEHRKTCSEKQVTAVENMKAGAERWLEHH